MREVILDLFAGPGGWDEGLRRHGRTDVEGIELEAGACATARAAGHTRRQGDVYGLDPRRVVGADRTVSGVISSAPCGGMSNGGLQLGRRDVQAVADLLGDMVDAHQRGESVDAARDAYLMSWEDLRSPLMAEALRWVLATDARWLVLEQVEAAEYLWEEYAGHLYSLGWEKIDVQVVDAADYGVPQHPRRRAVLIAHRRAPVSFPARTHTDAHVPASTVVGPGVMGFPRRADRSASVVLGGVAYRARDLRSTDRPAFTVTEKVRSWQIMHDGQSRHLTVDEAAQLQTFPAGYGWVGERSAVCLQIANAVPPALAAAVLAPVLAADAPYRK